MRHAIRIGMLVAPLCLAQCGGDEESAGEKACKRVAAKLEECSLMLPVGSKCSAETSLEICAANCMADAPCAEISSDAIDTGYFRCTVECQGAGPDDFICASGTAYLPRAGVCNGTPQCPDGSDEAPALCGAADAGGD